MKVETQSTADESKVGSVALVKLRRLAQQGDRDAEFALAAKSTSGDNVPRNYSEAANWLSKAAEQGHAGAQASLGAFCWSMRECLKITSLLTCGQQ